MRHLDFVAPAAALILTATLAGTAPPTAAAAAPDPQADVFGGYSYTQAGEASLHGGGLSGSFPFRDSLSFVADLSGHYGSFAGADLGQLGFMAGARWTWRTGRLSPFAEGLLGGVRTSASIDVAGTSVSDTDIDWGLAFGGGVDYQLGDRWAARGLVHLRLLWGEGAQDTDPRIAVGLVYRFGQ